MGNGNGAADDQRDIESVDYFVAFPAFFTAPDQMISDAIIAAQDRGSDQAKQFFRLGAERAGFVGLVVESEKALHAPGGRRRESPRLIRRGISENLPGGPPLVPPATRQSAYQHRP